MFGIELPQAMRLNQIEGRFDSIMLAAIIALASVGIVMVASSSIAIAEGLKTGPYTYLVKHAVFLAVGLVAGLVLTRIELRVLESWSKLALIVGGLLLVAVLVPGVGRRINGAQRWIYLGPIGFQAVEMVKLILIVWLASYMARYRDALQNTFWAVFKPMAVVALMFSLLLLQPDFGSAVLLGAVAMGMLWLGGANLAWLGLPMLPAVPLVAYVAMSESYRVRRLISFTDPWEHAFDSGFQLTQALIAIGRGEATGVGLGGSVQKLYYLPEAHTDFIFSVIAEETGFVGVVCLIACFAVLTWRAFVVGWEALQLRRDFAAHVAFGIGLMVSLQAVVSIGVNMGLLPTKGLTLPLISAGGSSVVMTCMGLAVLMRISYEVDRAKRQSARLRGEEFVTPEELLTAAPSESALAAAVQPISERIERSSGERARIEPKLGTLP
ncbi:MAG: putative lipid II flippase FtsW [Lysobacteraceae bacterium]